MRKTTFRDAIFSVFGLMVILFTFNQSAFAGNQPTATIESTGSIKTLRPAEQQEQFAAAQIRNESNLSNSGFQSDDSPPRSQIMPFWLILFLFGGIWLIFKLIYGRFAKLQLKIFDPTMRFRALTLIFSVVLGFFVFLAAQPTIFAGDNPTNTAESTGTSKSCSTIPTEVGNPNSTPCGNSFAGFAAAKIKYDHNSTIGRFSDNVTRLDFSFISSILILLGGIWALIVLLKISFVQNSKRKAKQNAKICKLVFQPSFALTVFGLLFAAVIFGSQMISTVKVSAEKRENVKQKKSNDLISPSNEAVFKTARQIGGDGVTQIGSPVFDAAGNSYVRGGFTRTLTIGTTTLTASRAFDLFVAKYDVNGNPLWARQGSGTTETGFPIALASEGATALTVDGNGNVYVGGSFVKRITLQGGANPPITLTDAGGAGINYESFVAKYDANGNLLWARGGNSGSSQNASNLETGQNAIDQIIVGADGNLYVAGFVSGNSFFGSSFTNNGQSEILLTRIEPSNGNAIWKQIIGGTDDDNGLDLKIDAANNLYLIGNFASPTITFPNGTTFGNPDTDPDDERSVNTFIAKFDSGGTNLWVKNLDNAETIGSSQIEVNPSGEIFLTGYFFDTAIFDSIILTESEGSGDSEASFGGYLAKMDADGNFIWAKAFGGLGEGIALDASGRAYVVGTFWDSGVFGVGEPNQESLASFGGEDLFVARFNQTDGNLDWAKAIAGSGKDEGRIVLGDPTDPNNETENSYNPLGIAYNPFRGTMFVSGDFEGAVSLDCQTLKTSGTSSQVYVAELSADNEPTNCRIWNGLDAEDNNWDSPENWNGGITPVNYDSVYVPYTGNSFDNPNYNPTGFGSIISNLTVSDDRTLTLERDLVITGNLWLTGGFVNTGAERLLDLTDTATANRIADADGNGGYIIGKIRKEFSNTNPFVFPVGTASGYSPVDVDPQFGIGALLAIKAVEQPQPIFVNTPNRINRYWTIDRAGKGFIVANLKFHYLQTDVVGDESLFNLFKVEENNPIQQTAVINTTENTATVNEVFEFSDWTLAEAAPTAANVTIGGRITTAGGQGISQVRVAMTDHNGILRFAKTNAFGYYSFSDVETGQNIVLEAQHKRYNFTAQIVTINEATENLNFSAQ